MRNTNLFDILRGVASKYPQDFVAGQLRDIPRIAFHISLAFDAAQHKPASDLVICDLGGGIGLFSVGCAAYGIKRAVLVDDFDDHINHLIGHSILDLHRSFGVEVFARDVIESGISDISGTFDIITSFDSIEHWHNSPKKLFHEVVEKLNPGGVFILGAPNCVNMRKRITVPFGIGKWSRFEEWYYEDKFRGHVREPDVNDLLHISTDMSLADIKIYGRNWLGNHSENRMIRLGTSIADFFLRLRPSFCSDIYLVGKKS
jgi:SAM-dependent methyltransferase